MNIAFLFKNRYFPRKFTESASTRGDSNIKCSSVETRPADVVGFYVYFMIYLSIYLSMYLSILYILYKYILIYVYKKWQVKDKYF